MWIQLTQIIYHLKFHGFCVHFTAARYLIAGGIIDPAAGSSTLTEVVELVNTNSTPSFGQLPFSRIGAVGAMLGNVPIICGGIGGTWDDPHNDNLTVHDSCISFQKSQWSRSHSMNEERFFPSGVQINSTNLWILGGLDNQSLPMSTTEFITQGQTNGVSGPKLPFGLATMCAVKFSEEEIFVIGGDRGIPFLPNPTNEVWIYNPQDGFSRKQGPSLNTKRRLHSCSTIRDGKKKFIIVAGGANVKAYQFPLRLPIERNLDSVEIYDPIDNIWHSGKTNSIIFIVKY